MDNTTRISALADIVADLGDNAQYAMGYSGVLLAAVCALVKTHPDAESFASVFRSVWTELGDPHANSELGAPFLHGISEALSPIEESSRVPLHVRAPSDLRHDDL